MDFIQFLADVITAALKHGFSTTTFILVVVALFRIQAIRRVLLKRLPKRFRTEDRLEHIAADVRAIKAHLGVVECHADLKIGNSERSRINGAPKKLSSLPAAYAHAIITRYFTRLKETYPSQQRRMNMKSKFFSRKFLMALATGLLVILNDGLDLGLNADTIMYVVSIVGGWIFVEGAKDTVSLAKDKKALSAGQSYHGE